MKQILKTEGYNFDYILGFIFKEQYEDTLPLIRYKDEKQQTYFMTTNQKDINNDDSTSFVFDKLLGYVFTNAGDFSPLKKQNSIATPLYRLINPEGDHAYTIYGESK